VDPLGLAASRRTLLAMAAVALGSVTPLTASQQQVYPGDAWSRSTPEAEGLNPVPLDRLVRAAEAGEAVNVDRLFIVRHGKVVLDTAFTHDYVALAEGHDTTSHPYNYQHPDHHPFYMGSDVHTLQSVTKSVTSILVGIAIARGDIAGVDAPLLSFLGGYRIPEGGHPLWNATLDDLLTMRTGIEWHEIDRPIDDTNTTIQLEASEDWVQFTLDQPMDAAPGEKWVYNSGGSHLMSAVIRAATGQPVTAYAEAHLFGPLGIDEYHWKITPAGLPDTEGGLYLRTEDLARIGYLYLRGGRWDDRQIVPREWVDASVARRVEAVNQQGWGYGYQWWRLDQGDVEIWAGLGYGGQFLLVLPEHDLVAVANSWHVFGPGQGVLGPLLNAVVASVADG
jgi:CubicO group peptidase (beta-lactamase class C family)